MAKKKYKSKSLIFKYKIISAFILILVFVVFSQLLKDNAIFDVEISKDVTKLPPEIEKQLKVSVPSVSFRVPILMYHYVEYVKDPGDTIRKSLNIVPFIFENQVKTLWEDGYTFITPSELSKIIDGEEKLPPKPIILTFDDGYADFYDNVFPILKKYEVKAVAYIISGFLDTPNSMYSWQVQELAKSDLIEIGAHTVHHVYLKGVAKQTAEYEIKQSKITLEELIKKPVVSFAYPSGAFDLQAQKAVEDAGFRNAVSTVPGIDASDKNKYFLYRIRPGARMGNDLLNYLKQDVFTAY